MINTIVHHEGAAAPTAARTKPSVAPAVIKLGLDIHASVYVVVAQYDHAALRPPRRFRPAEFAPWVEGLLREGHTVYVVYEACGFGFGLWRALIKAGAQCLIIAPRKLDEQRTGVKTDARDAATLCQRLSRYVDGNTRELAVIRVPTEEEEQRRHVHRQRESLVRARTKLQAQGRCLLINHSQAAPPHWWRTQTWTRLGKVLPGWLIERLEVLRPVLSILDTQIAALTAQLEAAASTDLPPRVGKTHQRHLEPRGVRLEPVQEPQTGRQLYRLMSRRTLLRREAGARQCDQAW
jgi:transposase